MRLISEIKVTVEDCRSNAIGGIEVGLEIWCKAVVPFLYGNSDCWVEMPKKAMSLLKSITHSFFRSLFFSAKGTPIVMYYWDTGILLEENFIILKKLLFLHHLATLPSNSLAAEIYQLQKEDSSLPGLVRDCEEYLSSLNISSDPSSFSKYQWRKTVKANLHAKNKNDLLQQINSYKKLDKQKLSEESYGRKSYLSTMTLKQSRTFFASRSMMLSTVQTNFKNDPLFAANNYRCECGEEDTQDNLLTCHLYEHLREGLDLVNSDIDLVTYYQLVINERRSENNT